MKRILISLLFLQFLSMSALGIPTKTNSSWNISETYTLTLIPSYDRCETKSLTLRPLY
jgi:hypothetical protein